MVTHFALSARSGENSQMAFGTFILRRLIVWFLCGTCFGPYEQSNSEQGIKSPKFPNKIRRGTSPTLSEGTFPKWFLEALAAAGGQPDNS
jgi:hypothetical protein